MLNVLTTAKKGRNLYKTKNKAKRQWVELKQH